MLGEERPPAERLLRRRVVGQVDPAIAPSVPA